MIYQPAFWQVCPKFSCLLFLESQDNQKVNSSEQIFLPESGGRDWMAGTLWLFAAKR
jgi:hypothetical protein